MASPTARCSLAPPLPAVRAPSVNPHGYWIYKGCSRPGRALAPPPGNLALARGKGFTYVGLLIFIAILGITAAAAVTAGSAMQRRSHEEQLLFIGGQFQAAFQSYYDATPPGQKPYPKLLADLVKDPRFPTLRRHLRRVYADPLTGKEAWGMIQAPGGGIAGVHSLSEQTPIKTRQFPSEFSAFNGKKKYSEWIFSYSPPATAAPPAPPAAPSPQGRPPAI